jgi:hypothetical protein
MNLALLPFKYLCAITCPNPENGHTLLFLERRYLVSSYYCQLFYFFTIQRFDILGRVAQLSRPYVVKGLICHCYEIPLNSVYMVSVLTNAFQHTQRFKFFLAFKCYFRLCNFIAPCCNSICYIMMNRTVYVLLHRWITDGYRFTTCLGSANWKNKKYVFELVFSPRMVTSHLCVIFECCTGI